jgi:glycosyltransferase involved in cell wall biosynthesis
MKLSNDRIRRIHIEPTFKWRASYNLLIDHPPDGLAFTRKAFAVERTFVRASRFSAAYHALWAIDRLVPTILMRSLFMVRQHPPAGTDLTYSDGHLVFRREPWVVEVEYPSLLLGLNPRYMRQLGGLLERTFASPLCRGIRSFSEAGLKSIRTALRTEAFEQKLAVIPHSVPARPIRKVFDGAAPVRLLFVGSGNIRGEFVGRGGWEVLAAFRSLRERFPEIELCVRSDLPDGVRRQYDGMPGLRLLDQTISREALDAEFARADIFMLPTHSTPPYAMLDAMSFELPIVTIGAWANAEFVDHGRTGLVVPPSRHLDYFLPGTAHPAFGRPEFTRAIDRLDARVVADLAAAVGTLIEDREMRRRMGKAGRGDVESGRFSISHRNDLLNRFLTDAMDGT